MHWKDITAENLETDLRSKANEITLGGRYGGKRLLHRRENEKGNMEGFGHWPKAAAKKRLRAAIRNGQNVTRYSGSTSNQYYIE